MTVNELAIKMAEIFIEDYIKDGDFDDFKSMIRCYGYDSQDIKDEVLYNMNYYSDNFADDGDYIGEEFVTYKRFMKKVYAELDKRGMYNCE